MKLFFLSLIFLYILLVYVNGKEITLPLKTNNECQEQTKKYPTSFFNWNDEISEKTFPSETSSKNIKFYDNIAMTMATPKNKRNFVQSSEFYKFGLYALIVAMVGDLLISLFLSLFYKGYSNMKMSISALGNPNSPVRWPFNFWMLIEGILFLLGLPALYKYYHPISNGVTIVMIVFMALFAIGACIFTCFFSVNESKEEITVSSKIHGVGSVIGFMLFLFVPLLVAILSFKNHEIVIGIISIISFLAGLFFFVLFVMSDKENFANTFIDNEGLWQRLNLLFMYLPLVVIAVKRIIE